MDDYPSNSQRPAVKGPLDPPKKEAVSEEDKFNPSLDKVVTGKVIRKKKSLGRRLKETFLSGTDGEDDGVLGYLAKQVIIPMVQDIVTRVVTEGIEKAVYGQVRTPPRGPRPGSRPHVSYNRPTQNTVYNSGYGHRPHTPAPPVVTPSSDNDEVVVETQLEAQVTADKMYEALETYGAVTVANLKELLGETPVSTDHRWGWTDLRNLRIRRVRTGYAMLFPQPEDLA